MSFVVLHVSVWILMILVAWDRCLQTVYSEDSTVQNIMIFVTLEKE